MSTAKEWATSRDGARIGWERVGEGSPLLVIHGGARAGKHYRALAEGLAASHTVLLMDRRGRGLSHPEVCPDLETALDDVGAVLKASGAECVFGHSAGAVLALEAARRFPIRALAVYEPPLLEAGLPLEWVPAFEAALAADDSARAFLLLARGLKMGVPAWLPDWVARLPLSLMMHTAEGREMAALLETIPADLKLAHATRSADYAHIRARTLILSGSESPDYLRKAAERLRTLIPNAQSVELPGQAHNAPDMTAPAEVAKVLSDFLAEASS
ncbi:MAG: alpha/beta hydrolase [Myxococcaceae bacterium]|nr:alpha/beta hydrolase [Myxococcaceae bacterium]